MKFNFWKAYQRKGDKALEIPLINSIIKLYDGIKIKKGVSVTLDCDPYTGSLGLDFCRHDKKNDVFISKTVEFPATIQAADLPESVYVSLKDLLVDWEEETAMELEDVVEVAMIRFLLKEAESNISIEYAGDNNFRFYLEMEQPVYSSKTEISEEILQEFLEVDEGDSCL